MKKIKNCLILADELYFKEWKNYLGKISKGDVPSQDIYAVAEEKSIHLFTPNQETLLPFLNKKFDLMIVEDEQTPAFLLAISSVSSQKIDNLVIASSRNCVE